MGLMSIWLLPDSVDVTLSSPASPAAVVGEREGGRERQESGDGPGHRGAGGPLPVSQVRRPGRPAPGASAARSPSPCAALPAIISMTWRRELGMRHEEY